MLISSLSLCLLNHGIFRGWEKRKEKWLEIGKHSPIPSKPHWQKQGFTARKTLPFKLLSREGNLGDKISL